MSRHRRRALAFAALAVVLAVAGLVELGRGTTVRPPPATATEVVVLRPVPAGTTLAEGMLGVVRLPRRYASAAAIGDPSAAVGRRVAVSLPAGTPLLEPELARRDRIATGRDVAVRLDDAAGLPAGAAAGARADVVLSPPGRAHAPTIVLANVLVVAAGRAGGTAVATLRLPAAAVGTIIAAEGRGSLRLVLRTSPAGG